MSTPCSPSSSSRLPLAVQERVGPLGRAVRVQREVEHREGERTVVRLEVVLEPLVLGARRGPVCVVVVLVEIRVPDVAVGPRGLEHVEPGRAGVERVPRARVARRVRVVRAAVRLHLVGALRRRHRAVLRPVHQGRRVHPVVALRVEQGDLIAGLRPERRAEHRARVGAALRQVAVVGLRPGGVRGVAGREREGRVARGDLAHHVGLLGVVPAAVHLSPVAEHGERERRGRALRDLRLERGSRVGAQEIGRAAEDPVAVALAAAQAGELRLPLILGRRSRP